MKRRTALWLMLAALGLLLSGAGLGLGLWRSFMKAATLATSDRLKAIGTTAATALSHGAEGEELLRAVRRDNQLEDAYLLDSKLRLSRATSGSEGRAVALWRIDPDRALRALTGEPSVATAYRLAAPEERDGGAAARDGAQIILAGYFPVPGRGQVLVLEAGEEFLAVPRRLRATAWGATFVAAAAATLLFTSILIMVRAAGRERELHGQAERGKAITQMAAMVAHEIRNPLGTIRAAAELINEQAGGSRELIGDILEEVDRLRGLTEEFLSLSREMPLTIGDLDMAALCDEVCDKLRRQVQGRDLCIERMGPRSAVLRADAGKLRQILLNLMSNGVQAMGGKGRLTVSVTEQRGWVQVAVADDGPGLSEKISRRLFEPFLTTKQDGTGLGLVVSRRIAELHGGQLDVVPREQGQRGAHFVLRLPVDPPSDAGRSDGQHPPM